MNKYLVIITTVLVATQIVRLIQNTIQLYIQNQKIDGKLKWIYDNDISEKDFETQREVFRLAKEYLEDKKNGI